MTKTKRKIFDITSYILIGIALLLAVLGIIAKFNNGTFYIFDVRSDVVLSDSMSEKNEKYIDFLKGHDDQIQKLDLVFSSKINSEEDINVYDIVLFKNPGIGTTMHRIVGKEEIHSDYVEITEGTINKFHNNNYLQLNKTISSIKTTTMSYANVEIVMYSLWQYDERYNFFTGNVETTVTVDTTPIEDYYKHVIKIHRASSIPSIFLISHKDYRNYNYDYFESLSIDSSDGLIQLTVDKIIPDNNNNYKYKTNTKYLYELRGDKAPNSDGKFKFDDIITKITFVMPKMGYFVRYITSIYGMILLVSLSVIIVASQIILEVINKKNKKKIETQQSSGIATKLDDGNKANSIDDEKK